MSWQSANEAFRTEWEPPRLPYSDEPAGFPCGMCLEAFFNDESRLIHRRQVHNAGWPHGLRARYRAGCHCRSCKRANADYVAKKRAGTGAS